MGFSIDNYSLGSLVPLDEQSSLETNPIWGSFSHLRIVKYLYFILPIIMILIPKHYFEVHHDVIDSVHGLMLVLHYP